MRHFTKKLKPKPVKLSSKKELNLDVEKVAFFINYIFIAGIITLLFISINQ